MSRVFTPEQSSGGNQSTEVIPVDYAAVPLDLSVHDEQYCAYTRDSLDRINTRVNVAFDAAVATRWASSELADQLRLLVQESLVTSHWERLDRNRTSDSLSFVDQEDERVRRASIGKATPSELLGVLEAYPKLQTLELAKLSHPLNSIAPRKMGYILLRALSELNKEVSPREPRYKRKTSRDNIPAAIILRKQAISEYDTKHGRLQVVQRTAFLTRGDEEVEEFDPVLDRKVRNPDRIEELGQKIEGYFPHLHLHKGIRWLRPIATSYYAKYLTDGKV